MRRRGGLVAGGVAAAGLALGGTVLLWWAIDETHFSRTDAAFDQLTDTLSAIPGVTLDGSERWVESPTFSDARAWIGATVDESALDAVREAACLSPYPDDVDWALRVSTDGGNAVTLSIGEEGTGPCPLVGLDAVPLFDRLDGVVTGLALYANVQADGRLSLLAEEDPADGVGGLLPLVAHAEDLRDAAGMDSTTAVEVGAPSLGVVVAAGEQQRLSAMLSALVDEHGVTRYFADDGPQIDGVDKVQVVAPAEEHRAVEARVRDSGLPVADLPVRFLPSE
nr:hypothetical protein [Microbacterium lemovicicum]